MIITHNDTQRALNLDEILSQLKQKRFWLSKGDKVGLSKKYFMSLETVNRHLRGATRRIDINMVAEALDIINVNQAKIVNRL